MASDIMPSGNPGGGGAQPALNREWVYMSAWVVSLCQNGALSYFKRYIATLYNLCSPLLVMVSVCACRLSGECVFQVEDHITVDQFSELMTAFQRHGHHHHSQGTVAMTTDNFRALLSHTLHRPEGDERISLLCNKVSCLWVSKIHGLSFPHSLPFSHSPPFFFIGVLFNASISLQYSITSSVMSCVSFQTANW